MPDSFETHQNLSERNGFVHKLGGYANDLPMNEVFVGARVKSFCCILSSANLKSHLCQNPTSSSGHTLFWYSCHWCSWRSTSPTESLQWLCVMDLCLNFLDCHMQYGVDSDPGNNHGVYFKNGVKHPCPANKKVGQQYLITNLTIMWCKEILGLGLQPRQSEAGCHTQPDCRWAYTNSWLH